MAACLWSKVKFSVLNIGAALNILSDRSVVSLSLDFISYPCASVPGILQARILGGLFYYSRGS